MTSLIPLLVAVGILLAGNGIQSTLLTLRAHDEGMAPTLIGLMGTAYFAGFVIGSFVSTRLIQRVGHIRMFAALAAIAASGALLLVLHVEPYSWMAIRAVMGFCFSGLFTVIESWLGAAATSENRGRVFSAYSLVDVVVTTGSQFALPVMGSAGFTGFAVMAMLMCLSLVPITLMPTQTPQHKDIGGFNFFEVWSISPLAFMATITIGLTTSAFKTIGPLYAQGIGLNLNQLAIFMGSGILGGAVLQLPFGWLSDQFDRRYVLMIATIGAGLAGLVLAMFDGSAPYYVYAGIFVFGAFAFPLYSLASAHANDFAKPGQNAQVSAGLLLTFAIGAMIGPLIAAVVIEHFGPPAFFAYTGIVHLTLVAGALIRMTVRPTVPKGLRVKHIPNLRTNPSLIGQDEKSPAKSNDNERQTPGEPAKEVA